MFPGNRRTEPVSPSFEGTKKHRVKPNFRCYYFCRLLLCARV